MQRRKTSKQIIYSPKPLDLEHAAQELIQGLPSLKSLRLHNPATRATAARSRSRMVAAAATRSIAMPTAPVPEPPKFPKEKRRDYFSYCSDGFGSHGKGVADGYSTRSSACTS